MLLRSACALLAGVLLAQAFEPVGLAVLLPLALAAWVLCLHGLPARRAWVPSLLFGLGFQITLIAWQRVVGVDAWLGLAGLEAAFLAPLGSVVVLLMRLRAWPVWVAVAWVAVETVRSTWPESGMPWGRLGFATADTIWEPALPWVGMTGTSLLVALTGTTLAWVVVTARQRLSLAGLAVLGVAAATALPALLPWTVPTTGEATIAAVQPDVPGRGDDLVAVHREVTDQLVAATEELAADVDAGRTPRPDVVVWPENSTAVDPFEDADTNADIRRASDAIDVPLLVGAVVDGPAADEVRNQGIVWEPGSGGGATDHPERYTKRNPVPFGEYIPWRDTLERLGLDTNLGRLRLIARDMVPGERSTPLTVGGIRIADAICFDIAYDDGIVAQVRNGGELLAVQTSNAYYVFTHQLDQQFEMTRLRAVETGRTVVVASTNGISAVVGPDGSVRDVAGRRTTDVLVDTVPLSTALTPAMRLGLWPGRAAVALTVLAALLATLDARRRRTRGAGGQDA